MAMLSPRFSCPAGCGFLAVKWSVMEMHLKAQNETCRWVMHCLPSRARQFAENRVKKPKASVTASEDFVIWKVPTTHRSPASMIVWSFEECRIGDVELVLSFDFACCVPGPVASCKKGAGYLMEYRTGLCDPNSLEIAFSPWRAEILNTLVFLYERVNNEVKVSKTAQENFVDPAWVCLETRPALSRHVGDTVVVDDSSRVVTWTVVQSECELLVSEAFNIGEIKGCFERQLPGTVRVHLGRPSCLKSLSVNLCKEGGESKIQVFKPDDEQKFITIEIDVGGSGVKASDRFTLQVIDVHNERKASTKELIAPESSTPLPSQAQKRNGSITTTSTLVTPINDPVLFEATCASDNTLCARECTRLTASVKGEETDDTKGSVTGVEDNEDGNTKDNVLGQILTVGCLVDNDVNDEYDIKAQIGDKATNDETPMGEGGVEGDRKAKGEKLIDAEREKITKSESENAKSKSEETDSTGDDNVDFTRTKRKTKTDPSLIAVENDAGGAEDDGAGDGPDKPEDDKGDVRSDSPVNFGSQLTNNNDGVYIPTKLLHTPPPGFVSPANTILSAVRTYPKVVDQPAPFPSVSPPPSTDVAVSKAFPKATEETGRAHQMTAQPVPCKPALPADGIPLSKEEKVAVSEQHSPDKGGADKHSTLLDSIATSRQDKVSMVERAEKQQCHQEKEENDSEYGKKVIPHNEWIRHTSASLRKTECSTTGDGPGSEKRSNRERSCDKSERETPVKDNMSHASLEGKSQTTLNSKGGRKYDSSLSWKVVWGDQSGRVKHSNANELKWEELKAEEKKVEEKKVNEKKVEEKKVKEKKAQEKLRSMVLQWEKNNDIQKWHDSSHTIRWRIVLKNRRLNDAMLKAITTYVEECINHNPHLKHYFESLDFAENRITDAGVDGLINLLNLPKVTWSRLSLYHNSLTDKSALRLSETLKVITTPPTELHLSDCMITDVGFLALIDALKTNYIFPRVDARKWPVPIWAQLRNNYISYACIKKCHEQGVICDSSNKINCYIHYCKLAKKNTGTSPLLHVKSIYDQKSFKSGKRSSEWQ
eukprot:GEMP01003181.1.p1 GENE.GEMP01003181.1~~GEMP01003181.1.p1  ORF type:complete len:1051 (+),score=245.74 GEMP01003181.1:214-3366(+)